MTKRSRVNIASIANAALARKEQRHGREYLIVPSATLPDGVVMNGIMYPAEEIDAGYKSLERTPAPCGHPMIGNLFVRAKELEAINDFYIGAWNENVRREGGRVLLDKVIDVEFANSREKGRAVLKAIAKAEPIHTSTGLFLNLEPASADAGYKFIARNMEFDHDAILLNEEGAATPEQGVGIFVNSEGEEIPVINSAVEWAERDLDWAVTSIVDALEKRERAGLVDRLKSAIAEAFGKLRETTPPTGNGASAMNEQQIKEWAGRIDKIEATVNGFQAAFTEAITSAITNALTPVTKRFDQIEANAKAAEEVERKALVQQIVNAGLLDEPVAAELGTNALKALAARTKPGKAAPLMRGNGGGEVTDTFADYDLDAAYEEGK